MKLQKSALSSAQDNNGLSNYDFNRKEGGRDNRRFRRSETWFRATLGDEIINTIFSNFNNDIHVLGHPCQNPSLGPDT